MTKYRASPDVDLATDDVRDSKGRRVTGVYLANGVSGGFHQ